MDGPPLWLWDEFRHAGVDYASPDEVREYDRRMSELRDVRAENEGLLRSLSLSPGARLLEVGTGTGAFARAAAKAGFEVVAIDISQAMLEYAQARASEEGVAGIEFRNAGFLTYDGAAESFDAIVSGFALHHLPDLWKAVALERMARLLKPGGSFLLCDVVFDWGSENFASYFERLSRKIPGSSGKEFMTHVRQEYSTLSWILDGLFERAGFEIVSRDVTNEFLHKVLARKSDSPSAT